MVMDGAVQLDVVDSMVVARFVAFRSDTENQTYLELGREERKK